MVREFRGGSVPSFCSVERRSVLLTAVDPSPFPGDTTNLVTYDDSAKFAFRLSAVSYTHLTLPTSDLV